MVLVWFNCLGWIGVVRGVFYMYSWLVLVGCFG